MHRLGRASVAIGAAVMIAAAGTAAVASDSADTADRTDRSAQATGVTLHARLLPLNSSGAHGRAKVRFEGRKAHVHLDAFGVAQKLPHAQHVHFGKKARHECPTIQDDADNNFRVNVVEGLPAYGGIKKSLTKKGDTSPASALAVKRFPTAPEGQIHYDRTIKFKSKALARAIKNGKGVIVIHGVDYNGNGEYDFMSAGPSELDGSLPAEATDPALCGVLRNR